jgi:hypothetical protein
VSWKPRPLSRLLPSERTRQPDDLEDKDEEINGLLAAADDLVRELQLTVSQASARLRGGHAEGEHDDGGR